MVLTTPLRSAGWRVPLAVALASCLILVAPPTARADITRTDFPSAAQVKSSMSGSGTWHRGLGAPNFVALGATPAACQSDLPFAAALADVPVIGTLYSIIYNISLIINKLVIVIDIYFTIIIK